MKLRISHQVWRQVEETTSGQSSQLISYKHGRKQLMRLPLNTPPNINRNQKLSVQRTCRVIAVCSSDCLKRSHRSPSLNHLPLLLKTTTTTNLSSISSSFSHRWNLKNHESSKKSPPRRKLLQRAMKTQKTSQIHWLLSMEVGSHRDHQSWEVASWHKTRINFSHDSLSFRKVETQQIWCLTHVVSSKTSKYSTRNWLMIYRIRALLKLKKTVRATLILFQQTMMLVKCFQIDRLRTLV